MTPILRSLPATVREDKINSLLFPHLETTEQLSCGEVECCAYRHNVAWVYKASSDLCAVSWSLKTLFKRQITGICTSRANSEHILFHRNRDHLS